MKRSCTNETGRRRFILEVIPTCTLSCLFSKGIFADELEKKSKEVHMFDQNFPLELTWRKYIGSQNFQFIEFAKAVQKRFGKHETSDVIKTWSTEFNLQRGQKQAEDSPDRSLKSYTRMFANPKDWEGLLNMEIVEDSDNAFELKISECIQAVNYIENDAADIGYDAVCWGDYAWAEGFNPKIKLVRDKTLMQGQPCCNHRYIWTG